MDIREILVVLRAERDNVAVLGAAAALARDYRAYVRGLCVFPFPAPTMAECYAIGEAAVSEVVGHLDQERDALIAPARAAFRASLAACEAEGDWAILDRTEAALSAPARARLVDIVILSRPEPDDADWRRLAEAFLMEGASSCLFVPATLPRDVAFKRIVVGWSGTREAKRALDEALPLLDRAEAIQIVIAGDPAETLIADRSDAIKVHLARHGLRSELCHVPVKTDVAAALLESCRSFGADLLVTGAYGHSRTAEALLGGVSRTILLNCPIPLLMAR